MLQNSKVGCLAKTENRYPNNSVQAWENFPSCLLWCYDPLDCPFAWGRNPERYGWMYSVRRRLCTSKHSMRNQARPEGSIAEAYVANEALTFCSRYFATDDVARQLNQVGRNRECWFVCRWNILFQSQCSITWGRTTYWLRSKYDKVVWYVPSNCEDVKPYIK
jgi:hypothetical protein